MKFMIWTQDGIKVYDLQVRYLRRMSRRDCTSFKIRDSVQLQTVLAVSDQETDRDRAMPSCQRLKNSGKTTHRSDDQDAQLESAASND